MNFFDKLLYKLYLKRLFRISKFLVKFLSIFNKNYKNKDHFYNFFKKRKKNYSDSLLNDLWNPRIFIFNIDIDNQKILNQIHKETNFQKDNEYSFHGHTNVYQSEHELHKEKIFFNLSEMIQSEINLKLIKYFKSNLKFSLNKFWYVITKDSGHIKQHCHFNADFSGTFYIKLDKNNPGALMIHNKYKNINIYKFDKNRSEFVKSRKTEDEFSIIPELNDIIVFNSYIEHSVDTDFKMLGERVSVPFDLIILER